MKKVIMLSVAAIIAVAAFATTSSAAGFRLPDQDSAAMGMAGAFVGQADNPSAVWYNPAGITALDGTRTSAGVIAIYPVMEHDNTSGTTDVSERKVHLPAELFATSKLSDRAYFGLGITSPFGLSTEWADTSATKYEATLSRVKTININPTIAFKLSDDLSFGAGIDYMILQATMNKILPVGNALFRLNGDGTGVGANAGVKYKAGEKVDLGLSYRSRMKVKVDGKAEVSALGLSNSAETEITLPDMIEFGASYKASERLTLNGDLDYTWWSTYDRLVVKSNTILSLTTLAGSPTDTSTDEKDWKNTWALRLGGQYKLSEQWKLRAGYVYDQNPVPTEHFDTRVPDADRQGVTLGAGFTSGNVTVDVAYMYLKFKNRTIDHTLADDTSATPNALNGTYKATAQLAGVTIAYKF